MFGAATAPASGFGKAPGGSGGFGTTTNTSTNITSTAGGSFSSGFGAAKGFGAPSAAPTAGALSFGVTPTTTTTAAPTSGFGGTTGRFGSGGFSSATTTLGSGFGNGGGFGMPQQQQVSVATQGFGFAPQQQTAMAPQPQHPTVTLQDFTRQSALASYLVQLDQSYNALHPKCHFTAFVYNSCGPGQMMDAIQKERYTAFLNGGGCSDEAYMQALQKNPDPGRLYPSPLHFAQELLKRTEKQKDAVKVLQTKVEELLQDVDTVAAMDAANRQRQREVEQEELMLRHRWYSLLRKMELLRRHGTAYGEESLLSSRVDQLRQHLQAPGQFGQLLQELKPYLREEVSRVAMMKQQQQQHQQPSSPPPSRAAVTNGSNSSGAAASPLSSSSFRSASGRPLLRSEVDPYIMKDWIQFAKQMQDGIEILDELLKTDLKEMRAIRERVESG